MAGGHGHPYSPAELELPGFVPQRLSPGEILAPFLGASLLVALAVWLISGNPTARRATRDPPPSWTPSLCTNPNRRRPHRACIAGRCGGRLAKTDRLLMCWWAFTGLT